MKFAITPQRAVVGTDLTVDIEAENDECIAHVTVQCDGWTTSDEQLDPPEVSYQQEFKGAVTYSPGDHHTVSVTATDGKGNQKVASHRWTDS